MKSISPYQRYGKAVPIENASLKKHVFQVTDTISGLADRYLGDWRKWRLIAAKNSIVDLRQIPPGTVLTIPAPELPKGRYEST